MRGSANAYGIIALRLNEDDLLEKVQAKGEQVWDSVPKWHWTGKSVDEVGPPAFKMK